MSKRLVLLPVLMLPRIPFHLPLCPLLPLLQYFRQWGVASVGDTDASVPAADWEVFFRIDGILCRTGCRCLSIGTRFWSNDRPILVRFFPLPSPLAQVGLLSSTEESDWESEGVVLVESVALSTISPEDSTG